MYEEAVGLGLGFLVYKRIMTELADAPVKEGVKVKAGQLLGWDKPAQFEEGLKIWSERRGPGDIVGPVAQLSEQRWGEGFEGPTTPLKEITFGIGGSLLPEGFELVGPSIPWTTRPKGLD